MIVRFDFHKLLKITLPLMMFVSMPTLAGQFVAYGAFTFGGDTLATADGDEYDQDLKAGGLLQFGLGYQVGIGRFSSRFTAGYKFDAISADNGDAEFDRIPLEALFLHRIVEHHVIGVGVVRELSPRFDLDVDNAGSLNVDYDDPTGYLIHYAYQWSNFELGARYTVIEYDAINLTDTVDGNNIGMYFAWLN